MLDFLEAKRITEKVSNNKDRFQEIIEDTDLCVCVTNSKGIFVACNDNYANMLGYKKDEIIGNSFLMVVPEERQKELAELHEDFIDIQVEIFRNWTIIAKDGSKIDISVDAGYTAFNGEGHKFTYVQPIRRYRDEESERRDGTKQGQEAITKRRGDQDIF